ncbi:MAG: cation:proton antiporter [Bacteroidota bacterium]
MPYPVFAAGALPAYLTEVVALVLAGAVIAYVSKRIGLVPIVGFLIAGVIIGPNQLGLVKDIELVDATAEIGVLLLLFTIGIEFSLEKLAKIRRLIVGGGGLQVGLTTAAVTLILLPFGVDWKVGIFTGFLVALSSTAIVLKLLGDRNETGTEAGQASVGLLIFQDIAIIVMVLLVPMLAGAGGGPLDIAQALGTALGVIVLVFVVAQRLMPPLLEAVARTCSSEVFLLVIVGICLGTAYLVGLAGVSISLGAFLAGLVVSESKFSEHAFGEILPLQILFSATFFVSVGMLLDLGFLVQNLPLVLGIVVVLLLLKAVIAMASVRMLGYSLPVAAATGLTLAQVGEFSFVLERAGREVGLTPAGMGADGAQTFIAATVLMMAATPGLVALAGRVQGKLRDKMGAASDAAAPMPTVDDAHFAHLHDHVIVAGYGGAARKLVRVLRGSGVPFVVATLSPEGAREAEAMGLHVLRGDYSKQHILNALGLDRAKLLVIPDDGPAMAHRVAAVAGVLSPTTRIIASTRTHLDIHHLNEGGVDRVIAEDLEALVALFEEVLRQYQIEPDRILDAEEALRAGNYAAFDRDAETVEPVVTDEASHMTRTVTIRKTAMAAERSLDELHLDEHDVTALAVVQDGTTYEHPGPSTVLHPGNTLTLEGPTDAFKHLAPLFRSDPGEGSAGNDGGDAGPPPPNPYPTPSQVTPSMRRRIDTERTYTLEPDPEAAKKCSHLHQIRPVQPSAHGCEDCLKTGDWWVHLRICMVCGYVGCCDSSPNQHARKHYEATGHAIIRSLEPGETWGWCYEDDVTL